MSIIGTLFGHPLLESIARIGGLALLACSVTAVASYVYRVRARTKLPEGATLILGLGAVAIYLNTRLIFIQFISGTGTPLSVSEALLNISVFVTAGLGSYGGRYLGTRAGESRRFKLGGLQRDFNPVVRAIGRQITVEFPDEIHDIDGYDPVRPETKTALAGRTHEFPRGLTVAELHSQLSVRLKEEHDVGYVDIELTPEGAVEYLAVGRRASGIGPTLAPNSSAVAVRADPPFSASAGDTVQLWQTTSSGTKARLGTGELRASVDNVATIATEESVAQKVDPTDDHRLMTLAVESHADREFAGMLRRGDETMSIVEVTEGSPLVGIALGALDVTIIAARSIDGDVDTIPKRTRVVDAGDHLFAIGRPEALRKLDATNGIHTLEDEPVPAAAQAVDVGPDQATDGERRQEGQRSED